jgi:CHRD domain
MNARAALIVGIVSLAAAPVASAQNWQRIGTNMTGFEEAAPAAVSTVATGQFDATINQAETAIDYVLSYADLEGSVTQAHIHFGQRGTNGGISVFLCTNLGNGPAGTQACPPSPATVTGTIMAADVIGPAGQGIAAGEFAELIRAIRTGSTYANVHSSKFPTGEVRGQLDAGHSH